MKQWQKKEQPPESFGKQFPEFSGIMRTLLWQRGLTNQKDVDEFFNPDYSTDLHDPCLLKDAEKAVERIFQALISNERVMVYGDYDSDGVCGAVIFVETLISIGFRKEYVGVYLPDREKEGYGLNVGAVKQFVKDRYNLIITVDCGTTSHEPIAMAKENGIDTIVTDHHRVVEHAPVCYAFVNPHQEDDEYPFKDLCGAGVAFKIACALLREARARGTGNIPEGKEKWMLDLVALATVTDVMPLLGENRTLVRYGLFVLAKAERLGLKALMEVSGVNPRFDEQMLSTNLKPFTLGFVLGPRLNAAGRMDHANTALALLNASSYEEALRLARNINERNLERQTLVENIVRQITETKAGKDSFVLFCGDRTWPIGVVGIVAGRVSEKYHKPAFIYQLKENGTAAGSVRTIAGFHVVRALESVRDLLINFGGHPQAGGFTVPQEKLEEMKIRIEEFARQNLKDADFIQSVEYCLVLDSKDVNWETYEEIQQFEPFGEANREPVFLLQDVKIVNFEIVGKSNGGGNSMQNGNNGKQHVRFILQLPQKSIKAMAFRMADRIEGLKAADTLDILCSFALDEWNGNRELMLRVVDFRKRK